ncbi:MAG: hypothetical protein WAT22_09625 [Saprospiraceae bacterium]|jgi:hypothetical protein|nr:hypothetical protein [Saprospiraceae bacterium]MBK9563748.1 hypothetical protein [Saprospiraceae bacterium]MBP6447068.1 hypothetical protein [Saprospiraceae bacterium]
MDSVIDVRTLSKDEIIHLVRQLLDLKLITPQLLTEVAKKNNSNDDIESMDYIESLINKHFEEYDEVFRKLA